MKLTKAKEVLNQYTTGESNFRGLNLRGQSFKGENLSGADFSEADIRSTNFTGAILRGANFTGAKCGLQNSCSIVVFLATLLLCLISGFFIVFNSYIISLIFNPFSFNRISGWISLVIILVATIEGMARIKIRLYFNPICFIK